MPESAASPLAGPPSVTMARTAPFWPAMDISVTLPALALVNTGSAPIQITRIDCDPLADRETGAAMTQALSAAPPAEAVPPGRRVVRLRGTEKCHKESFGSRQR